MEDLIDKFQFSSNLKKLVSDEEVKEFTYEDALPVNIEILFKTMYYCQNYMIDIIKKSPKNYDLSLFGLVS